PITIEGLDSEGSDVIANIGNTNQVKLYEAETGHKPMWNPNMFGGMPVYHRHNPISWSLDSLIWGLDGLIDWRVWYLFLGALGMFFLARFLGLSAAVSLLPAVAFVLIPHMHALNVVGHFSKLRALMWVPWLLLVFLRFLRSRSLLDTLLFTAVFALQLRTQHYQIVFYAILLLFAVGIYPYLKLAIEKQWGDFLRLNGLFVAAIALVLLIVAQPLFITRDYAPFSTRGGNAVVLDPTVTESDQKGAGFDYATNWSYTVSEWWNLIIPRFHGGTSTEVYEGEAVPQLSGRPFPAYWGELPFTQSYEYLSAILAFLALVAIFFRWERVEVKALALMTLLALLLSLGRNFEGLYKLLFNYLPYFDKFRVPMMILTMVGFNVCVLAAIGLDFLANGGLKEEAAQKRFYILTGIFTVVLILPLLFGSGLSLSSEGELQR
ncbi:MAG TPA: hypothetical protein PKV71_21230, partial [Calditrichia bacterium]|nr:hypothetical protein [Calditrichia bacterium]